MKYHDSMALDHVTPSLTGGFFGTSTTSQTLIPSLDKMLKKPPETLLTSCTPMPSRISGRRQ